MSGGNRIQTPRLCLWRASHESRTQTPIHFFVDVHERLEVLCVLYLCYWKWAAACILETLMRYVEELLGADPQGRVALYQRAFQEAVLMVRPKEFSVVCNRHLETVKLLPRAKARRLGGGAANYFSYHP